MSKRVRRSTSSIIIRVQAQYNSSIDWGRHAYIYLHAYKKHTTPLMFQKKSLVLWILAFITDDPNGLRHPTGRKEGREWLDRGIGRYVHRLDIDGKKKWKCSAKQVCDKHGFIVARGGNMMVDQEFSKLFDCLHSLYQQDQHTQNKHIQLRVGLDEPI